MSPRFPFPLVRPLVLMAAGLPWLPSCQTPAQVTKPALAACATTATVRDLTSLDGCGKVLELADGQRLRPEGAPWASFASTDGQRVLVNYEVARSMSTCMVGEGVRVTCIRAANALGK